MTEAQKKQIVTERERGRSYAQIACLTGLSVNSVKSCCRRHAAGRAPQAADGETQGQDRCEHCGRPVEQVPGCRHKRFCSDRCRMAWWNSHQDRVKRRANYEFTCPHCQKRFTAYGNANRKYCSHRCYIAHRYGGEA